MFYNKALNNFFQPIVMKRYRLNILFSIFFISIAGFLYAETFEIEDLHLETKELYKKRNIESSDLIEAICFEASEDNMLELLKKLPSFGMFKDNYFLTGVPTNKEINKKTADAKFQISIQQRLTKATLPLDLFLLLTYTQKSFWDIYRSSSPFEDSDYNPGLSFSKAFIANNYFRIISR